MRHRAVPLAALLALARAAEGQLATPVQRCVDAYHYRLSRVSLQAGKSARACLLEAARGPENDPDTCIGASTDGRIVRAEAGVQALYDDGTCTGGEPIQRGAAIGNAAHRGALTDLARDLFGSPVTAAVIDLGRDDARCVDTAVKRALQAFASITGGHRRCAKDGMQRGAVVDAATLDAACGTFAQIDGSGAARARLDQLTRDVDTVCGATATGLAALFPGLAPACHASGGALGDCLAGRTRCRACLALDRADGQQIDCDRFDDGAADGSCSPPGTRTCTFAPSSRLFIQNSALPLDLAISGAATIACGTADAAQTAPCACDLATVAPLVVPAIGDFCITAAAGCPSGGIDCVGGTARDVDLAGDHNIGPCASNAACARACDAHCAGLGASYVHQASGCEGYCQGGASDELPCAQNSGCPGATCVGNAAFHGNICNCICEAGGLGAPRGGGALDCSLGLQVDVELPSDGACLGTSVATLPPRCVRVTTATATGLSRRADNTGLSLPYSGGLTISGTALSCETIARGSLGGLQLVGHTVFFDSTLGDNFTRLSLVCQ